LALGGFGARHAGCEARSSRQCAGGAPMPGSSPACTPASQATPSAVVSATTGRSTGAPRMSARNCIVQSLATMPPSTRSTVPAMPFAGQSARMASSRSAV
jgi:hypothetical protein